ncbi:hypothetical protein BGZ65_008847 [Modicella reniformis]|uniref:Uncharacterized protein n=1 Tax=Modicella reniformis TaxID=1440133 RepID=A0A9P6MAQ1_9FUNG|nr:hypothetical protein BGZ65_008847 [Modicella reniformis]
MPSGTGLAIYELKWSAGSASAFKDTPDEHSMDDLIDFPGWVNEESVTKLYRDLRGQFRPIISTIEDITAGDDPDKWGECINNRLHHLTRADFTLLDQRKMDGNLCLGLHRVLSQVESTPDIFGNCLNIAATLKTATAMFITYGGFMAYHGKLPEIVEVALAGSENMEARITQ